MLNLTVPEFRERYTLPDVHAGLRRQTPALPRATLLLSVKRLRVKLFSLPRLRFASGAGRSDANVTRYRIQKP